MFEAKGRLLLDKQEAETATRLEENEKKLKASQANNSAPKLVLMNSENYGSWVGWYLQLMEIVSFITSDQVKAQIVYDSLSNPEDKRFLLSVTQFSQHIRYLKSKYHRPRVVTATILARGTAMKKPGADRKIQKKNILTMLGIKRDLSKLGFISKLDSFYINLTAVRIFTDSEYEHFLRESHKFFSQAASKRKTEEKTLARTMAAVTSSKLVEPDAGGTEPEDPWKAVDAAEADRNLSEDEDDDDSTSVFSL